MNGEFTYTEITTQAEAWAGAMTAYALRQDEVAAAWNRLRPRHVVFTGCGSTHYLALSAAHLFQSLTHTPARGLPASELLFFETGALPPPPETLLVAVSRSGTTTETLAAVERFRQRGGGAVWTVTCYPDSPLAALSDVVLPAELAQEESVAQTRSFASMLLLCQALAAHLGGAGWERQRVLPDLVRRTLPGHRPLMSELGGRLEIERVYFLGSGPAFGVASEAMLKLTEMSLTASQAFHFMEFRHGPMSMADERTLMVGLVSPTAGDNEMRVLAEMAARGAPVLAIAPGSSGDEADWAIPLPDDLPAWALPVLYLPPLQLFAYYRAQAKGLDPDNPRNLTQVITLDPNSLLVH
jgi:glucosamine--fructose-6-phosphate aminotransferase (isomerizing)